MKKILGLVLGCSVLAAPLFAADDISVIVNGKSYQCSTSGTPANYYFCKCSYDNSYAAYKIGYYSFDKKTGYESFIRYFAETFPQSTGCEAHIASLPQCH